MTLLRVPPVHRFVTALLLMVPLAACEQAAVVPGPVETPVSPEAVAAPAPAPQAVDEDPPMLAALRNGMPPDVSDFIRRAVVCNHWAGEEPYDDERRAQINLAVQTLRCRELDADQLALAKQYHDNVDVLRRIQQSRRTPL
jgi:hypothetical protein